MNFPYSFGHPPQMHPFYPLPNPIATWNYSSLGFPYPIPPPYPLPAPPLYSPQNNTNLLINQHHSHFYGPSQTLFPLTGCTNPYFQKLAEVPIPQSKSISTHISKQRQKPPSQKKKDIEVIQISDGEQAAQGKISKSKKRLISKEKRLVIELNKLNSKKYGKLLEESSENLQKELKQIVQTIEAEPKRKTRGSAERFSKVQNQPVDSLQIKKSDQKRKTLKKQTSQSIQKDYQNVQYQEDNIFKNFDFQTIVPQIKSSQQFHQEKLALKQALILRSFKSN